MKQKIYLEDVPLDEAMAIFEQALKDSGLHGPLPSEPVNVAGSSGRTTAEPVWAAVSAPHYNASAMDGFALRSQDTDGATETSPVRFTLLDPGEHPPVNVRCTQIIDTGQPLPMWADAVVMVEHTQRVSDEFGKPAIEIRAALPPWHHVRLMGEDMVASELVVPANHRLRPVDLGALAGSGHDSVKVFRSPRVAIVPTGSELVNTEEVAKTGISPGKIIEYNSIVLAAQVEGWGGIPTRWPIVPDDYEAIKSAVIEASSDHDLILVNAGSSAGTRDFTADVVESLGKLLVHGVAVRPGHPVILGILGQSKPSQEPPAIDFDETAAAAGTEQNQESLEPGSQLANLSFQRPVPIIGVPGYPVSAALTGEIFIEPLLRRWQGLPPKQLLELQATVTRKVVSHTGDDDFVRVSVGKVGDQYIATPISRGAGVISSLVRADGIVRIPRFSEGLDAGSAVNVQLYRTRAEIDRTIVAIGSHDLTLDLLSQFLSSRGRGQRLSSANVGSLGGLIALRRGEAHIAGTHLLDPDSGEYNDNYVQRYLPGREVVLISLVEREQGWIVPAGNPRGVSSWEDVQGSGVRIINRQRGAGTRVLLDFELEKRGIRSESVLGYDKEAYTHLAVAAAVASGIADAGLGIAAAARALRLDFVPLAKEQYELVMMRDLYEAELLKPLLEILADSEFKQATMAMPGYDVRRMGEIRAFST